APIVIADFDMRARDADAPGDSSVAVFARHSNSLTLRRASVTAGRGADGISPAALVDFAPASAPNGTSGASGGAQTPNPLCPASIGGAGGKDGATAGGDGKVPAAAPFPAMRTGAGGVSNGDECGA